MGCGSLVKTRIMDDVDIEKWIKEAKLSELFMMIWWNCFNSKRYNKLFELLGRGMSWHYAYKKAKKI